MCTCATPLKPVAFALNSDVIGGSEHDGLGRAELLKEMEPKTLFKAVSWAMCDCIYEIETLAIVLKWNSRSS